MNSTKEDNNSPIHQIDTLEEAFNLLNKTFLENKLLHVMINQQSKRSDGYFFAYKWKSKEGNNSYVHKINLAPSSMNRTVKEVAATLKEKSGAKNYCLF